MFCPHPLKNCWILTTVRVCVIHVWFLYRVLKSKKYSCAVAKDRRLKKKKKNTKPNRTYAFDGATCVENRVKKKKKIQKFYTLSWALR